MEEVGCMFQIGNPEFHPQPFKYLVMPIVVIRQGVTASKQKRAGSD